MITLTNDILAKFNANPLYSKDGQGKKPKSLQYSTCLLLKPSGLLPRQVRKVMTGSCLDIATYLSGSSDMSDFQRLRN